MPVVKIDMWEGKTKEEKEALIKNVTQAVSDSLNIEDKVTTVLINELPRENWGIGGNQASKIKFE